MEGENMGDGLRSVVEELELERNQLQEQILSLEEHRRGLEDRLQLQARVEALQNETEKLQNQLAGVRTQQSRDAQKQQLLVSDLSEQLRSLTEARECLQGSLLEKESALAQASAQLQLVGGLRESLSRAEVQRRELEDKLLHAKHDLENVSNRCSSSERRGSELKTEVDDLTLKLSALKEKADKQEVSIEALQAEQEQTNEELDRLNSAHLEERAQLIHDLQSCERQMDALKDVLMEKEREGADLAAHVAEYAEQVTALKQELKVKEESLVQVEDALVKAEREARVIRESQTSDQQTLNGKMAELMGRLKEAESELVQTREERSAGAAELERLTRQAEEDEKTIRGLRGDIQRQAADHRGLLSDTEAHVSSLKEQLAASLQRLQRSEGLALELRDRSAGNEELRQELADRDLLHRDQVEALQEEQSQLLAQVQRLENQLEERKQSQEEARRSVQEQLKAAEEHLEEERRRFTAQLHDRDSQKEALSSELKRTSETICRLETLREEGEAEKRELEEEGAQRRRDLADVAAEKEALQGQKEVLSGLLRQKEVEVTQLHERVQVCSSEVERLQQDVADKERSAGELRAQVEAQREQREQQEESLSLLRQQESSLRATCMEKEALLQEAQARAQTLMAEVSSQEDAISQLRAEARCLLGERAELQQRGDQHQEELACLEVRVQALAEENRQLLLQVGRLTAEEQELTSQRSLLLSDAAALQAQLLDRQRAMERLSMEKEALQEVLEQSERSSSADLLEKTGECVHLSQTLRDTETQLQRSREEADGLKTRVGELGQALDHKERAVAEQRAGLEAQQDRLLELQDVVVTLQEQGSALKSALADKDASLQQKAQESSVRQEEALLHQERVSQLLAEVESLQRACSEAKQQEEQREQAVADLTAACRDLRGQLDERSQALMSLSSQLAATNRSAAQVEAEVSDLKARVQRLTSDNQQLLREDARLRSELQTALAQASEQLQLVADRDGEVEALRSAVQGRDDALTRQESLAGEQAERLRRGAEDNADLRRQVSELQARVHGTQRAFSDLRDQHAAGSEELQDARRRLSEKTAEALSLQTLVDESRTAQQAEQSTVQRLRTELCAVREELQRAEASNSSLLQEKEEVLASQQSALALELQRLKAQHMQVVAQMGALTENLEQREMALRAINGQCTAQAVHVSRLVAEKQSLEEQNQNLSQEEEVGKLVADKEEPERRCGAGGELQMSSSTQGMLRACESLRAQVSARALQVCEFREEAERPGRVPETERCHKRALAEQAQGVGSRMASTEAEVEAEAEEASGGRLQENLRLQQTPKAAEDAVLKHGGEGGTGGDTPSLPDLIRRADERRQAEVSALTAELETAAAQLQKTQNRLHQEAESRRDQSQQIHLLEQASGLLQRRLDADVEDKDEVISSLSIQVEQQKELLAALNQQLKDKDAAVAQVMEAAAAERVKLGEENRALLERLESSRRASERSLEEVSQLLQAQRSQVETKGSENLQLLKEKEDLQSQLSQLSREKEAVKKKLQAALVVRKDLMKQLEEHKEERRSAASEVAALQGSLKELSQDAAAAARMNEERVLLLEEKIHQEEEEILELRAEGRRVSEQLQSEQRALQAALREKDGVILQLQRLEELEQELALMKSEKLALQKKVQAALLARKEAMKKAQENEKKLGGELAELKDAQQGLLEQRCLQTNELNAARSTLEHNCRELEDLRSRLDLLTVEAGAKEQALGEVEQRSEGLRVQLQQVQTELEDARAEVQEKTQEMETDREDSRAAQEQLQELRRARDVLTQENQALLEQRHRLQEELEAASVSQKSLQAPTLQSRSAEAKQQEEHPEANKACASCRHPEEVKLEGGGEALRQKMNPEAEGLQMSSEDGARSKGQEEHGNAPLARKLQAALVSRKELLKENAALKEEVETLSAGREEKEARCEDLEQQNQDLQGSVSSVLRDRDQLAAEARRVLGENRSLSAACDSLKLTIEDMAQQKQAFSCQLESLKDSQTEELSRWRCRHAELKQEYQSLLQAYESIGSQTEHVRRRLQEENRQKVEELQEENRRLREELAAAVSQSRAQAKNMRSKVDEALRLNSLLTAQIQAQKTDAGVQQEVIALLQKDKEALSERMEDLQKEHELQLSQKEEALRELKEATELQRRETVGLNEKVRILEDDKSLLQEELQGAQKASDTVKSEKEYLQTAVLQNSETVERLGESVGALQAQNAQLVAQLAASRESSQQVLQEKEEQQVRLVRELEEQLRAVRRGSEGSKNVKEELQELLREKHQETRQLQQDCIRYQELILDLERSLRSSQNDLERSAERAAALEERRSAMEEELLTNKKLLQEAELKVQRAESEKEQLASALRQPPEKKSSRPPPPPVEVPSQQEAPAAGLQQQLEELQEQKEAAGRRAAELQQQLDARDRQVAGLQRAAQTTGAKVAALAATPPHGPDAAHRWEQLYQRSLEEKDQQLLEQGSAVGRLLEEQRGRDRLLEDLRAAKARLERSLNQHSVAAAAQQRQLFVLSATNAELSDAAEATGAHLQELAAQVEALQREKDALSRRFVDKDDSCSRLQRHLQQMEEAHVDTEAQLHLLRSQRDRTQAELEKQEGVSLQLRSLLQGKDAEISSLLSCRDGEVSGYLRQLQAGHRAQAATYEDRLAAARRHRDEADASLRALQAEARSLQTQLRRSEQEKEQAAGREEALRSAVAALRDEREQLVALQRAPEAGHPAGPTDPDGEAGRGLKQEVRKLLHQMDDLNSENAMLRAQLLRYREDLTQVLSLKDTQLKTLLTQQLDTSRTLEGQKAAAEEALREARAALREQEEANGTLRAGLVRLEAERVASGEGRVIAALRDAVAARASECSDLQQELASQQAAGQELRDRLGVLQQEAELSRTEREAADRRGAELAGELLRLEQQLSEVRGQSRDAKAQNEALGGAMAALQDDRDRLVQDFKTLRGRYDQELREARGVQNKAERRLRDADADLAMLAKEKDILVLRLAAVESGDVHAALRTLLDQLSRALPEKERALQLAAAENHAHTRQLAAFSRAMASLQDDRDRLVDALAGATKASGAGRGRSPEAGRGRNPEAVGGAGASPGSEAPEPETTLKDGGGQRERSTHLRSEAEKTHLQTLEQESTPSVGPGRAEEVGRMWLHADLQRCVPDLHQDQYLLQLHTKLQEALEEKAAATAQLRAFQERCHWLESQALSHAQGSADAEVAPGAPQERSSGSLLSDGARLRERLLEVELGLAEERARREETEEALRQAEDRVRSLESGPSRDVTIEMDPEEEWDALSLDPTQPLIARKVKGGVVACRRWLRGRSLYFSRLLTGRARSRYLFLAYLLSLHMLVLMCFTGTL